MPIKSGKETRASIKNNSYNGNIFENSSGLITPDKVRAALDRVVDNSLNITDDSTLTGLRDYDSSLIYSTGEACILNNIIYRRTGIATTGSSNQSPTSDSGNWVSVSSNASGNTSFSTAGSGITITNGSNFNIDRTLVPFLTTTVNTQTVTTNLNIDFANRLNVLTTSTPGPTTHTAAFVFNGAGINITDIGRAIRIRYISSNFSDVLTFPSSVSSLGTITYSDEGFQFIAGVTNVIHLQIVNVTGTAPSLAYTIARTIIPLV